MDWTELYIPDDPMKGAGDTLLPASKSVIDIDYVRGKMQIAGDSGTF